MESESSKPKPPKVDKVKVTENTTIMSDKEEAKPVKDEEEEQRSKYQKSPLLLEYEMTQEMHNYYGKICWEIISIFIAGSLALVGFSLQSPLITRERFVVVPITVTLVMIALYFLYNRIAQLVNIHLARLWQIEETAFSST